ncbi:MAG TPA: hypothetical protein VF595_16475 [Tepidisphaeraceae bacterium]|jgi:hypothetical protein
MADKSLATDRPASQLLEGGVGASDATNGGGAATGIPDGDTAMRAGDIVDRGNIAEDKARLFPDADETSTSRPAEADAPKPKQ